MAVQIQLRRGTTAEHSTFTGAVGEITMDTTKNVVVLHNGSLLGGFPLALASGSAITAASLLVNNNLNISSGNAYQINGTSVLNATTLGSAVVSSSLQTLGTIGTGTWQGTAIANTYIASGLDVGKLTAGSTLPANVTGSSLQTVGTLSSLTVSGDLTVDTSTLKVDSANNRVGIGTVSPSNTLHLVANNTAFRGQLSLQTVFGSNFAQMTLYDGTTLGGQIYQSYTSVAGVGEMVIQTATASPLVLGTNGTEKMRLDASGNLGLGVTPSAWATVKAFQLGYGSVYGYAGFDTGIQQNAYYNAGWKYVVNGPASQLQLDSNNINFKIAPNGTAGNAITFTQAMTLDASGNLGIGATSSGNKLFVQGTTGQGLTLSSINTTSGAIDTGPSIIFEGHDGSVAGRTFAEVKGAKENGTSGNYAAYLSFSTRPNGGTATERMRITSDGRVGIGASNPEQIVEIRTTAVATPALQLASSENSANALGRIQWRNTFASAYPTVFAAIDSGIGATGANPFLAFYTADTSLSGGSLFVRMRIDNAGNLGIGTTTPTARLEVSGSNTQGLLFLKSPTAQSAFFVSGSGNVGIGTTIPTARLTVTGSANITGSFAVTGSITENGNAVVTQADIGSGPNEIPLNQYLGTMAYQDAISVTADNITVGTQLIVPLTSSASPQTGSLFFSGSFIYVYTGTQYRSASLN